MRPPNLINDRPERPAGTQPKPNPPPNPAHEPEWEEMSGNEREVEKSNLTFRRQAALPIIAASPTISQAASTSGIGESTLRRWLEDDHFLDEMTCLRRESANLAHRGGPRTVNVIWRQLKDPGPIP